MDHNDIRHKLSEYIDGAITPQERAAIEQHIKTCTACSEALAEFRKTIEHIHQIEEIESPAWMTQKIMAKVREEQEAKHGFWQRIFVPFFTRFPVQAVAVLFLSVTAFYIYTTMHPAEKYAEAPMGRLAKQEAQDGSRAAHKQQVPEITERREKKIAQEPGFKSLDMKNEYEKPAEPAREEGPARGAASAPAPASGILEQQPAPAPAKRNALMSTKDEAGLEKRLAAPKAAASAMIAEQTAPEAGSSVQMESKNKLAARALATSNAYRERTYRQFVDSISTFPYRISAERRERLQKNYSKLSIGMSKDQVADLLGEPDTSGVLQAKDPPFKQLGSEWRYYFLLTRSDLVNEKLDQSIFIFYSPEGKVNWIIPSNIEGLTAKGHPRQE